MNEAAGRLDFLVAELSGRLQGSPPPDFTDIDLSGVTRVDACGCQLLALFLENLNKHHILPRPGRFPEELQETVVLLGFGNLFTTAGPADKETT